MNKFLVISLMILSLVLKTRGKSTSMDHGKIVGGTPTSIDNAPWMAALRLYGFFACGASLIAPQWILTAAHCVVGHSASAISARFGSDSAFSGGTLRRASLIKIHPDYRFVSNDLALVKLSSPVNYSSTIQPINLATATRFFQNLTDHEVLVYGQLHFDIMYGRTSTGGSLPDGLLSAEVIIQSPIDCSQKWGRLIYNSTIHLCASAPGKDACQGDSGGPLMGKAANGLLYQVGITSFGAECANPDLPGVYTKVDTYYEWIWKTSNSN